MQGIDVTKKPWANISSTFSHYNIDHTAWKVFKYGVFSGPYFSAFGPEKTPYLDTFHAVSFVRPDWLWWCHTCTEGKLRSELLKFKLENCVCFKSGIPE